MEKQGEQIASKLDKIHPESAPHVCVSGFRYSEPRTGQMIEKLKEAERIILFSQYPQHSCSTSGSSLCDAYRWLDNRNDQELKDKISVIDQWWDRDDYSQLWAFLIQRKFDEMKEAHQLKDEEIRIIYSAHSLPEAYCLEKGDKYNLEITGSFKRIEKILQEKGLKHEVPWHGRAK